MPQAIAMIAYAHGIFADTPDSGDVFWGWLVQDSTGKQVAEEYDCGVMFGEHTRLGAEYEAVSGPVYWADEKGVTGLIICTDHQAMIDFFAPGHQPTDEEIKRYGTEALGFFREMGATIEYVAEEQNPAVAVCQKAKDKQIDDEAEEGQSTVKVVETWLAGWSRVAEAIEEMQARIRETGMAQERTWLNDGIILQMSAMLEGIHPIIRAFEDTYPITFRIAQNDAEEGEERLWDEDDESDDM